MIKLYAKTNENNTIIQIKTSDFIKNLDNWHEIGEQESRHFHEKIADEDGVYFFKLENNKKVNRTAEEMQIDIDNAEQSLLQDEENKKDITMAAPIIKALAMVVADLTGKTPQQIKQMVRDKL